MFSLVYLLTTSNLNMPQPFILSDSVHVAKPTQLQVLFSFPLLLGTVLKVALHNHLILHFSMLKALITFKSQSVTTIRHYNSSYVWSI